MGTQKIDKASRLLPADSILLLKQTQPFVGRGGLKMQNFLRRPKSKSRGLACRPRASTGGFTDCLLQEGAGSATCVGVGHGQLHYKLRTDSRVTNLEKTNLRHLTAKSLPQIFVRTGRWTFRLSPYAKFCLRHGLSSMRRKVDRIGQTPIRMRQKRKRIKAAG